MNMLWLGAVVLLSTWWVGWLHLNCNCSNSARRGAWTCFDPKMRNHPFPCGSMKQATFWSMSALTRSV